MTWLCIDGTNLVHRCYHAQAARDPESVIAAQVADQAVRMMRGQAEQRGIPLDRTIVALDAGGVTFRHLLYPDYKAHRSERPEALTVALDLVVEQIAALGLRAVLAPGYEADDILATLAGQATAAGDAVLILSSDRDLLQCCDNGVTVLRIGRTIGEISEWTIDGVIAEYGCEPHLLPDYKALAGDTSDNYPGLVGVGPVTARRLVQQYGDLDGIMAAAGSERPTLAAKLATHRADAYLYRQLATLVRDVAGVTLDVARALVTV